MDVKRGLTAACIGMVALAAGLASHAASRDMSATFDEIILVSGGVRGLVQGRWEMVTDQPPLMMYAYGAAARGAVNQLPPETRSWEFNDRWTYARGLFFRLGNDPQEVLGRARAVSAAAALLLVVAAGLWAWWIAGPVAAVLGASMTALVPDVLAHGGVAYNDLPLALAFLLALWGFDAWLRKPSPRSAVLAAAGLVAAFGMKLSALGLLPVAVGLLVAEGIGRRSDKAWRRDLAMTAVVGLLATYVGFVLLYRGDPALTLLRYNFWRTVGHASGGHEAPAYLLGALSAGGWWYYFPLALLLKTPVGLQALVLGGGVWAVGSMTKGEMTRATGPVRTAVDVDEGGARQDSGGSGDSDASRTPNASAWWVHAAAWKGRAALLGAIVFLAFLVRSDLNAGVRYALPLVPLLVVIAASGLAAAIGRFGRAAAVSVMVLLLLQGTSTLAAYPHFLSYGSLWAGGSAGLHRSLVDSNLDWGQGLLELRRFMADEGVASVRLSYFGSAPPDAYGIEYVALPSFFGLQPARTAGAEDEPRFTVISATNLYGLYLDGADPFADYRAREPYRVLGHSMFVFDDG